jgi:dTDP-4-dehydrorhamnose 3,5-epimerase
VPYHGSGFEHRPPSAELEGHVKITPLPIPGAAVIAVEPIEDSRGFFATAWGKREFEQHGLSTAFVQGNMSLSRARGTLRGMHYQAAPFEEEKLIRCIRGAIYDVVLDLRPDSPTFGKWAGAELSADNRVAMYIPKDCAHGFITLSEDAEVFYLVTQFWSRESERGVRYNDPAFGIEWPVEVQVISDKDKSWPDFQR